MKKTILYGLLITALVCSTAFSLGLGAMQIPIQEVLLILAHKIGCFSQLQADPVNEGVLNMIRMPRVVMGILVGAGLGISGAAIQGIFRNPLAEPGLIGISAGASLMAVLIIALETAFFAQLSNLLGYYLLAFGAFAGAGIAAMLVYQMSKSDGRPNVSTMLLAGVAINALAGALTGLVTYMATEQQLRTITFWMLGSLGGATWENVLCLLPFVGIPLICLPLFSRGLNIFSIGESQVELIGLNPNKIKAYVVLFATMAVGASVAVSGIIGFVGLLVPHTIRLLGGVDHRFVLPASALFGALVLTLADMLSRTLAQPVELPIGVVTAILGTPLFIYILMRDKKKFIN